VSRVKHPLLSSRTRETTLNSRWVRYEGKWYNEIMPVSLNDVIQRHQGTWVPPGTATAPAPAAEAPQDSQQPETDSNAP
jgi:hypothetical protein